MITFYFINKVTVRHHPTQIITSYVYEYNPGYTYVTFSGIPFEDGLYNITVTGIDRRNVASDPVLTSVTVLTSPPTIQQGNSQCEIRDVVL